MNRKQKVIKEAIEVIESSHRNKVYFFTKATNPEWLRVLDEKGYFEYKDDPSADEKYHKWPQLFFLENIGKQIRDGKVTDASILELYVNVLRKCNFETEDYFSNRVLFKCYYSIPISLLKVEDITISFAKVFAKIHTNRSVDGIFLQEVFEGVIKQLDDNDPLDSIVAFVENYLSYKKIEGDYDKFKLKNLDSYNIKEIIKKSAGIKHLEPKYCKFGVEVIKKITSLLIEILNTDSDLDKTSSIWRTAVPLNSQTEYSDSAQSTYMLLLYEISKLLLKCQYACVRRVVIALATIYPEKISNLEIFKIVDEVELSSNYRYELFHYLRKHFDSLLDVQKDKIISLIDSLTEEKSGDEEDDKRYLAYKKLRWLSAIKKSTYKNVKDMVTANLAITKERMPEHPEYSTYMSSGWVTNESPITEEQIAGMTVSDLLDYVKSFKETDKFRGPTKSGLSQSLQSHFEGSPERATEFLNNLSSIDYTYISSVFCSIKKAWEEKKVVPYSLAIERAHKLIMTPEFNQDLKDDAPRVQWAVSSIVSFLRSGTSNDDNAFEAEYITKAKDILVKFLDLIVPDEGIVVSSDYFTRAINETKGKIWEALILLVLRNCRLKHHEKEDFTTDWKELADLIFASLKNTKKDDLSLFAHIGRYYRQFLFMGGDWIYDNLSLLLPDGGEKLSCRLAFLDGFSYVTVYISKMYEALKSNNNLIEYLRHKRDERDRSLQSRVIDLAVLAAMFDGDFDILKQVVEDKIVKEWKHFFSAIASIVRSFKDEDIFQKAKPLIKLFLDEFSKNSGLVTKEHLQTVDDLLRVINDPNDDLVESVIKIAAGNYASPWEFNDVIDFLHKCLEQHPKKVCELFVIAINHSVVVPSYPEEKITAICTKMKSIGMMREFRDICDRYSSSFLNGGVLESLCK